MYGSLQRAFKINGCIGTFFHATNGILQGCPLSVALINMLTSIWKKVMNLANPGSTVETPSEGEGREGHRGCCAGGHSGSADCSRSSRVRFELSGGQGRRLASIWSHVAFVDVWSAAVHRVNQRQHYHQRLWASASGPPRSSAMPSTS